MVSALGVSRGSRRLRRDHRIPGTVLAVGLETVQECVLRATDLFQY